MYSNYYYYQSFEQLKNELIKCRKRIKRLLLDIEIETIVNNKFNLSETYFIQESKKELQELKDIKEKICFAMKLKTIDNVGVKKFFSRRAI